MSQNLAPEHFADWNEQMVRRYDQEAYERGHPSGVVRWVENKRVRAVLRKLNARPEHRILDVGCGAGYMLSQLSKSATGGELHGIDLSKSMSERAQQLLGNTAKIVHGDAEQMPYADAYFDRVIASSLFSHVLHPETVVLQLKRILKPDGLIVISVCDDDRIERGIRWTQTLGLQKRFFGKPDKEGMTPGYSIEYHLHRFSLNRMREVVGGNLTEAALTKAPFVFPVHWIAVYKK